MIVAGAVPVSSSPFPESSPGSFKHHHLRQHHSGNGRRPTRNGALMDQGRPTGRPASYAS